ncbi:MAG: hypothetical protein Q9O24_08685 [Gammaproteobacteria bacterium]|nr:hypothetical protein [Gammaproteobacteria bacterium]
MTPSKKIRILPLAIQKKIFWGIFFLLAANIFWFSFQNTLPYIKADGWRFIDIYLIPWNEGTLTLSSLFKDHHPQPIVATLFIINAELFNLRMDYEGLLGVLFIVLSSLILIREFEKHSLGLLASIASAIVIMSLVSTNVYTWSLVTIGYIEGLFSLLVIIKLNKASEEKFNYRNSFIQIIWLTAFLTFFGDGAKLVAAAIILAFLISSLLKKDFIYLKLSSVILISIFLNKLIYSALGLQSNTQYSITADTINKTLEHFVNLTQYIGIGLMSAWGNISDYKKIFDLNNQDIEVGGTIILLVYILTFFIYYKSKIHLKTQTPITLIILGILTALAGWIFRYNPDMQEPISANIPRYYRMYSLSLVGIIWVWVEYIKNKSIEVKAGVNFAIILIISSHLWATTSGWNMSKYIRKGISNVNSTIITHGNNDFNARPSYFVTGNNYPEPYKKSIKYIKENKMNLFMEKGFIEKYNN